MGPFRVFRKLVLYFDLATAFFRSFELSAVAEVMSGLNISSPILDIGCAEGIIGQEILSKKNNVYGLDCNQACLRNALAKGIYKNVLAADASRMPFLDRGFGMLFSNSVLEHIPDVESVLREAGRILKNEGLFLFTVPNHNFSKHLFYFRILKSLGMNKLALKYAQERNKRLAHFHLYSQEKWSRILRNSGLKAVFMRDYIPGPALMIWDLIASVQFLFRKLFGISLKIPIINNIFFLFAAIVKLLFSVVLIPFLLNSGIKQSDGCATLILAKRS